jgi:hypothetical protein
MANTALIGAPTDYTTFMLDVDVALRSAGHLEKKVYGAPGLLVEALTEVKAEVAQLEGNTEAGDWKYVMEKYVTAKQAMNALRSLNLLVGD